ncbi:TonB-dependent receptor plug domain-containing protein [Pseudomonas aeruginosa]|uniref:TonB-dependent receptor plug domain-containing protein n=1 Tax=Pseudomonas aeruginosa TaxID=287 RepID=UPI002E79ABDD|nr:TonB-dependent receptor plug domain-containing protein [Pseudomonas aeruginosa]MEE1720988.1 TonB-dependent receptor plug domain-containing protein [Pseudomonas aeruginosa]
MKTQITFAALLPALASFIPLHAHASSTSEDEMIVTGNTAADTTDSAAGAGFKTNDIDVGPLGTKSWIETPYSSTTVTKEMIENQQAQSVSEMLKYSPSTQMQARGGMDVGRPR